MSILHNLASNYEKLWKTFVRPPRVEYNLNDEFPERTAIGDGNTMVDRIEFSIEYKKTDLSCTLFVPYPKS